MLGRIKKGEQLLDLGCCLGQDLRKLAYDGAPSENMYASDIDKSFWTFGYDLFLDRATLKSIFLEADIFDPESQLKQLDGKIDIVNATSFFHLFDYDGQVKAAKRVVQLLKPNSGSTIIGRQGGQLEAGNIAHVTKDKSVYWHNPESWAKMWEQVGRETGTEWKAESLFDSEDLSTRMKTNIIPASTRLMRFTIRRV